MESPFEDIMHQNESSSLANISIKIALLPESSWKDDVKPVLDYLLLVILIVVMLAMGCEVTWQNIWRHVKRPIGLSIGLLSQFIVKPLCAFALLKVVQIDGLYATGVLIIACCPGGVLSNTFTYFCHGDIGLSVTMTTSSTILAMAMMPANLWLYGRSFESESLVIPYKEMALSLVSVTSPVLVGMLLKMKVPTVAKWAAKFGSYCGVCIMIICIVIELVVFPNMFDEVPPVLYGLTVLLPLIGLGLGYLFSMLARESSKVSKTVAIECGVQNVPVALTIIAMSFPIEMQEDIVLLPWLYGFVMVTSCSIMSLIYNYLRKRKARLNEKTNLNMTENGEVNKVMNLEEENGKTINSSSVSTIDGEVNKAMNLEEENGKTINGSCVSTIETNTEQRY